MTLDLFSDQEPRVSIGPGAALLRGFARPLEHELSDALQATAAAAPFRNMVTPGGYTMSVAMTACGRLGWVTDHGGYRYDRIDPETARPWPDMPGVFASLARDAAAAAGYTDFTPDSCLINRYRPGNKLSLHQDKDERDFSQPIVSVSLGLPATFLFGGPQRSDPVRRHRLHHADVVVWGGPSRLFFHGVAPVRDGTHLLHGNCRINLTFRRAS
jgi:alkylated DNA repair protein (DNA oxidative demethylase)